MTSSGETAKRYRGSSSWKKIIDGVNVIVIVLKEVGVDAATPTITKQPEGETKTFAAGGTQDITKELMVEASVSDGGTLIYQWYSNTSSSTTGGTPIEDATSPSYKASVSAGETKYFYCIVTNTNNNVSGNKTASVTSNVAILASIEGSLTSINATYNGNPILVGESPSYSDFTVTENYSGGNSVEISTIDGLYTVDVPKNSIGYVPVTITSKDGSMQTQVPVQIMYELNESFLAIAGAGTVTQNGNLELTAEYKADGNDVQYNLYNGSGSSNTHKVIENVSISWTGVNQSNKWTANAETNTVGPKTATVKLSKGGDQWCVTTDGVTKTHEYTVNAITQTYNIGDGYQDDSGALIGYVFEVSDSYIKIVETSEGPQYYWCGTSTNINNWSDLINISDGEEMYNAVKNQSTGDNSIFTYANNKNTSGESGWYIPTKEELFDIFIMNETHGVLNISGAYWSSSLESITGGYTAYYVQGTGESDSDLGTNYITENSNSVVAVKKIEL